MQPATLRRIDQIRDALSRSGPPGDPPRCAAFDALAVIEEELRLCKGRILVLEHEARLSRDAQRT